MGRGDCAIHRSASKLVPAVAMRAVVLRHAAVAAEARMAIGGGMLANRVEPVATCDRSAALPAADSDLPARRTPLFTAP